MCEEGHEAAVVALAEACADREETATGNVGVDVDVLDHKSAGSLRMGIAFGSCWRWSFLSWARKTMGGKQCGGQLSWQGWGSVSQSQWIVLLAGQ